MRHFVLIFIITGLLSGCSAFKQESIEIRKWRIVPEHEGEVQTQKTPNILVMGKVAVTSPFDTKALIVRKTQRRYEDDFYNEFISIPSEMIGAGTQQWLSRSGIFPAVVNNNSGLSSTMFLEANVEELYADYRNTPEAVISIEYFLTNPNVVKSNPIYFKKRYQEREPILENSAKGIVQAEQRAFQRILEQFEVDLNRYLAKGTTQRMGK